MGGQQLQWRFRQFKDREVGMKKFILHGLLFFCLSAAGQEKLVDVTGAKYNVFTKGLESRKTGQPIVVFEGGMGSDLRTWNKVINEIAAFSPVFAYDRAGIGKSANSFKMPTITEVSGNLHRLLNELKIAPPYILVGHSLGGVYIRGFAGLYPDEIAGLVFVDPADFTETRNDWNNIFRKLGLPESKIDEMLQKRLYQPVKIDSAHFTFSGEAAVLNEWRRNDFKEVAALPMPRVPIYFFVGGKFEVPPERRSKEYDQEAFFHIKNNSNVDRWKKLIYASGKSGALIYLTNAGHYIQNDEPRLFIANVKVLVESLK